MNKDVAALLEKRGKLSNFAQLIRSQKQNYPDNMILLAKTLSRQARLDVQLEILGVPFTQEIPTISDESCPF